MRNECKKLQDDLREPDPRKLKEYMIRLIYCEMFGFKSEFGYIHAINLTQNNTDLVAKRVGYLAVCTFLHPSHELLILAINSVQKDLQKDNVLEVCAALTTICKLMNNELIPAVESLVIKLLDHKRALVRKKAVMALHRFISLDPSMLERYEQKIRSVLCDQDPSVMSATLCIFEDGALRNPKDHKDLIPSFVSILKQIIEGRLPKEYNYHRVPAPWIQIKILRILAALGANDRKASEHMYTSLFDCMKRADSGINAGYAVVYECVRTIAIIYPNTGLLDAAANSVARFLTSNNHNLRYLGITALSGIVAVNPKYAAEHQMIVINCLEDQDETLKRKTLDLLYMMTNPKNVVFIVAKLIKHLKLTTDTYLRQELVSRITELAERFSPDNEWFIKTLNTVFLVAGDLVAPSVAHNLMQLIAIGPGDDERVNDDLRRFAVAAYTRLLERKVLLDVLTQVVCWVLGEFGHLSATPPEELVEKMCELLERQYEHAETRSVILSAMLKLSAHIGNGYYPPVVQEAVEKYQSSANVDTQQRSYEFSRLVSDPPLLRDVLPRDAFDEDLGVDPKLGFLDGFVMEAVARGSKRYQTNAARNLATPTERVRQLNFAEYERPVGPDVGGSSYARDGEGGHAPSLEKIASSLPVGEGARGLFGAVVETKWTEEGYAPEIRAAQMAPKPTSTGGNTTGSGTSGAAAEAAKKEKRNSQREREAEQMSEKAKEASELFQFEGDGVAKKSSKKTKKHHKTKDGDSKSSKKTKKDRKPKEPAAASAAAAAAEPAAAAAPAPPKSAGGSLLDLELFGGMSTNSSLPGPAFSSPPASAAKAAPQGLDALFDLGGGGGSSFLSSVPAPNSNNSNNSPFGSAPLSATPPPAAGVLVAARQAHFPSFVGTGLDRLAALPLSVDCNREVDNQPRSHNGVVQTVSDDPNLHVGYVKVYRPESTIILLYVSNKSDAPLSDVRLELKIPDGFAVTYVSEPGLEGNETGFRVASIAPKCTAICTAKLLWRKHAASLATSGTVRFFTSKKEPRGTSFTIALGIQDVMRPEQVPANDFPHLWQASSQEKKMTVPQSKIGGSVMTLHDAFKPLLNMHPVSMAGQEVRAAAVLAGTEKLVLVSAVAGLTLSLTVRSNDTFLSDLVLKSLKNVLV